MSSKGPTVSRERIERCARMYHTSKEAADAIGISPPAFRRLCLRYNVLTPSARRNKKKKNPVKI